jgi:uncharacterized protein (DUF302 family)
MSEHGIVSRRSAHSVDDTVARIKALLDAKQITLFALIDHSGEAAKVGMPMRPTKLLVFGSPRAGTPAMLAGPSLAIDLPLKLLVWEDEHGAAWISYNSPAYLADRHSVPSDVAAPLAAVEALATAATAER